MDAHCTSDGLCHCCRYVVHRDVCHRQTDQLAHHRLEFPHRLQHPLTDLRLVGSVGSQELSAGREHSNHRRDEVSSKSGCEEAWPVVKAHIGSEQSLGVRPYLLLGLWTSKGQRGVSSDVFGNI